ncbi:MAG: SelB C-terminal domain-containing protein [Chloroflexi bacterium]|nr:SelB C-terminal domain-containing protein [Chloroflexota bacterium]
MSLALIFPGQGSQAVGMGRALAISDARAAAVFATADEVLGFPLSGFMTEGPEDELTATKNAQPAILAHSVAVLRVVEDELGPVAFAAGHSLGEFSAHVAAGTLSYEDALAAVHLRGELMFRADQERPGTMAAVLGLSDDEVEALPAGVRARIRGLQTHGQQVDLAPPGRRTAVNLTGLAPADLHRGMVLAHPGALRTTRSVDVRLRAVPYLTRPVRHNLTVTLHTGAAEVEGRLLLLDAPEVRPGDEAWAQVRLVAPVCALRGDHFVIRDPNDTLGGGLIVDTDAPRHRRFDTEAIARLETLARGSPEELLLAAIALAEPATAGTVASDDETRAALATLTEAGDVIALGEGALTDDSALYTRAGLDAATESVRDALASYHAATPLRPGMPREELRGRLRLEPGAFDQLMARLTRDGLVAERGSAVGLASHSPALTAQQEAAASAFLAALRAKPFSPPTDQAPEGDVLAYLEGAGEVVRTGGVIFAAEAYRELVERIETHLRAHETITLAQARDMFGTSRKYVQALLEHLDAQHITRRVGDLHVLR